MKKSALAYEECSAGSILFSIGSFPKERIAITYMKLSLPNKIILSALSLLWGVPSVIFGVLFSKEILYSLIPYDVYYLVGAISILAALVIIWLTRKRWVKYSYHHSSLCFLLSPFSFLRVRSHMATCLGITLCHCFPIVYRYFI